VLPVLPDRDLEAAIVAPTLIPIQAEVAAALAVQAAMVLITFEVVV
jgi:hypothetical protein